MALRYAPALANLAVYGELGKESKAQKISSGRESWGLVPRLKIVDRTKGQG